MHGLMRGRWSLLTAVVRGRRVRRSGRERLQVGTSALLYHSTSKSRQNSPSPRIISVPKHALPLEFNRFEDPTQVHVPPLDQNPDCG